MNMRHLQCIIFCIWICVATSCQNDEIYYPDSTDQIQIMDDGRLRIPFSLEIPEREVVQTKGTAASSAESAIRNAYVLVFDQGGAEQLVACTPAKVDPTDNQKIYAILQPYNRACHIHIFANLSQANIDQVTQAATLNDIRHLTTTHQQLEDGLLPLSSARIAVSAINAASVNQLSVPLHFVYSRIDVKNTVSDFVLQTCQLINVSQEGYLIEHADLSSDMGGQISGSVRQASGSSVTGMYLFENSGVAPYDVQGTNPTDLLIKGRKGSNAEGYYKVRLSYIKAGTTLYDINRGVRYEMTLKEVKGVGYTTAAEALLNEPSNVLFDIYVEDNTSKNIVTTNGQYYLGVSNSEFILFADNAIGITAFTLSHNIPATVSNRTVTIQSPGVTFSASQTGMNVSADRKQATLLPGNGTVQKIPVKLDFANDAAQQGFVSVRLGDLVKDIPIKKRRFINNEGGSISASEIEATRMSSLTSLSSRITVNSDKSLTITATGEVSKNALALAEGFITDSQGSVLIAIKRETFNVVYYEKYKDNTYGFFYVDKNSTLNNSKIIVETGYGVAGTVSPQTLVRIGAKTYTPSVIDDNGILSDYSGAVALVNQNSIAAESQLSSPLSVYVDNRTTVSGYMYPNFAKGVYASGTMGDGVEQSPFLIRTPKQLQNINPVIAYTANKYFAQDCDIDMSTTEIGGMATFSKAIVGDFSGTYNGNSYFINNLKISGQSNLALFEYNGGRLIKICMSNSTISGFSNVACLAADNGGVIEQLYITQPKVTSSSTTNSYAAAITGHNYGSISNCLVEVNTSSKTAPIQGNGKGVGVVTGCNHTLNAKISDICIVDLDPNTSFSAVKGGSVEFVGGAVGKNAGYVTNILFLARAPYYKSSYCQPIIGNRGYLSEDNYGAITSYYIKGSNFNTGTLYDNSLGYNTTYFSMNTTITGDNWGRVTGYPYPMLKSFKTPLYYPSVF